MEQTQDKPVTPTKPALNGERQGRGPKRHGGPRRDDRKGQDAKGDKGDKRRNNHKGGKPNGKKDQGKPAEPKKVLPPIEQRSVVDRGRTSVEVANEEGTTSVETQWTITKVGKFDAVTRKPLEVGYLLGYEAEGVEAKSFNTLAEARAAVGKTIAHPEKLTKSKADHAASKGGKK
jgi:hypothetical protein